MYQTDLTDDQKNFRKITIPMEDWHSKYDIFSILDAIIHVDISGCQWRTFPRNIPNGRLYIITSAFGVPMMNIDREQRKQGIDPTFKREHIPEISDRLDAWN